MRTLFYFLFAGAADVLYLRLTRFTCYVPVGWNVNRGPDENSALPVLQVALLVLQYYSKVLIQKYWCTRTEVVQLLTLSCAAAGYAHFTYMPQGLRDQF